MQVITIGLDIAKSTSPAFNIPTMVSASASLRTIEIRGYLARNIAIADGNTVADTDGNAATAELMLTLQNFSGFGAYAAPGSGPPTTWLLS